MTDREDRPSTDMQAATHVEPTRQYLFSEGQIRGAFLLSAVGMAVVLVGLLLLATSRPQGTFQTLDTTEFSGSLEAATAQLEGYALLDDGRARLDIDRAMELVAERGVVDPGFARVAGAAGAGVPGEAAEADAAGAVEGDPDAAGDDAVGIDAAAEGEPAAPEPVDGAAAYAVCASCHQPNGEGIPGAFPPLAGHAPELYSADPGFPIVVMLYGMMGPIEVDGTTYNGLMPAHAHLSDVELAAILNHVMTGFGNQELLPDTWEPYQAQDFAERREQDLSFDDVYTLRQEIGLP